MFYPPMTRDKDGEIYMSMLPLLDIKLPSQTRFGKFSFRVQILTPKHTNTYASNVHPHHIDKWIQLIKRPIMFWY